MHLYEIFDFILSAQAATAQQPPRPGFVGLLIQMVPMLFMIFFVFYIMVIKPEQKKSKAQEDLVSALKKGDHVVTSGGVIGRVVGIESDHLLLEVSPNVKVKFLRKNIISRFGKAEAPAVKETAVKEVKEAKA